MRENKPHRQLAVLTSQGDLFVSMGVSFWEVGKPCHGGGPYGDRCTSAREGGERSNARRCRQRCGTRCACTLNWVTASGRRCATPGQLEPLSDDESGRVNDGVDGAVDIDLREVTPLRQPAELTLHGDRFVRMGVSFWKVGNRILKRGRSPPVGRVFQQYCIMETVQGLLFSNIQMYSKTQHDRGERSFLR